MLLHVHNKIDVCLFEGFTARPWAAEFREFLLDGRVGIVIRMLLLDRWLRGTTPKVKHVFNEVKS